MAIDLSWLWQTLVDVTSQITNFFQQIWSQVQNITNTGQGIFAGFSALGSALWDGIRKFSDALVTAFDWLKSGFAWLGDKIRDGLNWIGSGFNWIAQQLYNFGNWLYNALFFIGSVLLNVVVTVWNAVVGFFSGIATTLKNWWSNTTSIINSWWTNTIIGIRQKIRHTVMANITIMYAWKGGERILTAKSIKDMGLGVLGLALSPITGAVVGSIVDAVIPSPSTSVFPLVPDVTAFEYTPPTIEMPTIEEKPTPEIGTIPEAPTAPIITKLVYLSLDGEYVEHGELTTEVSKSIALDGEYVEHGSLATSYVSLDGEYVGHNTL